MAKKYNKYGAGHKNPNKNLNKITLDDLNKSPHSRRGMGHQECYDKGYTYISVKIDGYGMCLWADPQQLNKSIEKLVDVDEDILKMSFFGMIAKGKAMIDPNFYVIAMSICDLKLDNKNSVRLEVDTKEMTLTLSQMELTLENVYEYENYLRETQKTTKV